MRVISDVGEFSLIDRIGRAANRHAAPQFPLTIGDDAAIFRPRANEDLVISTDALVEDTHFRWSTQSAAAIGRRALVANLSDLAAMGARPVGFTLALSAPPSLPLDRFDALMRGLLAVAAQHGCPLVGGNLARARQTTLAITIMGAVARGRALLRSALRPGDRLFVTGTLGGSALAQRRAERLAKPIRRVPTPRLEAGLSLSRSRSCRACIDISDGLASDLQHVLEASAVGAEIDADRIPLPRGFRRACSALGADPLELALEGGEDYELLFGLGGGSDVSQLSRRLAVRVTEIGSVTRKLGVRGLPAGGGFRHF